MINSYLYKSVVKIFSIPTLFVLCLGLMTSGCISAEDGMKNQAELLLGFNIPENVEDFQSAKIAESSEYAKPYTFYMKGKMTRETYLDLVEQLALTINNQNAEDKYTVLLLTQFQPRGTTPNWWNPNIRVNEYSGAGAFHNAENDGWVIATYHDGYAYIKAYEDDVLP